jgi:hypothetical protein
MVDELRSWWQNVGSDNQALLQDVGVVLVALVGGHFLGVIATRMLSSKNFDNALRLPGTAPGAAPQHGITPTLVAGLLVRLTVWAGAVWWLAWSHGQTELAGTVGLIIKRTWALTAILVTALGLGGLLAQRLIDCLQGLPGNSDAYASRNGSAGPRWDAASAVGVIVYGLVVLLVLLIAADLFDWPLTRTSVQALWQFAHHLMVAGSALVIGCLGARWARDLVTSEGAPSTEKRAGQYTGLAIVAATTVLAVAVLLSSAGVLLGVAALALIGLVLYLVRGYLPDIGAGLQLRTHKIREVWFEGTPWQVSEIGFLTTQVSRQGSFWRLQNRQVLHACMNGQPSESVQK